MKLALTFLLLLSCFAGPRSSRAETFDAFTFVNPANPFRPSFMQEFFLPASGVPDFSSSDQYAGEFGFNHIPVLNIYGDGTSYSDVETITFFTIDGTIHTDHFQFVPHLLVFTGAVSNPTFIPGAYSDQSGEGSEELFIVPVTSVPEPSTLALFSTGALGTVGAVRRRMRLGRS